MNSSVLAEAMIEGIVCCNCLKILEVDEIVFRQVDGKICAMPLDGEGIGYPVYCEGCKND